MELEKRGIPTVTIVGDRFVVLANYERQALGLPELPLAVVEYPIGGAPAEEARRRGHKVFGEVVAGLTGRSLAEAPRASGRRR